MGGDQLEEGSCELFSFSLLLPFFFARSPPPPPPPSPVQIRDLVDSWLRAKVSDAGPGSRTPAEVNYEGIRPTATPSHG